MELTKVEPVLRYETLQDRKIRDQMRYLYTYYQKILNPTFLILII